MPQDMEAASPDDVIARAPISLTPTEKDLLLSLVPAGTHCDDADCPLEDPLSALMASTRERLEGKPLGLGLVGTTNFGRDKHEAALGSTVTSVQLSVAEVDFLRGRLEASEGPLRDSLLGKLELLRNALMATRGTSGQTLAELAAFVGLGGAPPSVVPVTVLTGCLGAGKTTVIRALLAQLPAGYTCAWLKNEYGDAGVDRMVAQDSRVAVKEIVNGCLCCTKVGELDDALRALHSLGPHRILVEASGSALPGPMVWEIEKCDIARVDGVVTVVDCANFARINNFSRTAKIQAKCTDLVLLNKVSAPDPLAMSPPSSVLDRRAEAPVMIAFELIPISELCSRVGVRMLYSEAQHAMPSVPSPILLGAHYLSHTPHTTALVTCVEASDRALTSFACPHRRRPPPPHHSTSLLRRSSSRARL